MAAGSGWIKVGGRLINLDRVQEIDLEDEECDYGSWVADKDDATPPAQRCVTLTFGFGGETHNDEVNFFCEEAEALRAWLTEGDPSDATSIGAGPLQAVDVMAWRDEKQRHCGPAFQIGG
jgi:hypothetical protein